MKNIKRYVAFVLSLSMVFAMTVSAAAAENNDEVRAKADATSSHKNVVLDKELFANLSTEEIIEILRTRKIEEARNLSEAEINNILARYNTTRDSDDEDYVVSKATVLAYLCTADGISVADLVTANGISNDASTLADARYGFDEEGLEDSYRHFIWNHMLTNELSNIKARTITCNYEWQAHVLTPAQNLYYDLVAEYLMYPNLDALSVVVLAYDGAMRYALELRDTMISNCEGNFDYYLTVFENGNIRDIWNNWYGRQYADRYTYGYLAAFVYAYENGDLIMHDTLVTSDHQWGTWEMGWYIP